MEEPVYLFKKWRRTVKILSLVKPDEKSKDAFRLEAVAYCGRSDMHDSQRLGQRSA